MNQNEQNQPDGEKPASPADESPQAEAPAQTESPEEASGADAAKPAPRWGAIVVVLVLAAAGIAAALTWPQWSHLVMAEREMPAPAVTNGSESLRAELAATQQRLARLEATLADRPAAGGEGVDAERLQALENAIQTLRAQPQVPARLVDEVQSLTAQVAELRKTAADAAAVLRLADRVEQMESTLRDIQAQRSSAAALLLATGQLREAVNHAMPFDAELRALRALAPQDAEVSQAVEALKPHAASGIPTRLVLAERFEKLAPELVRSDVLPQERNWWRETLHQMSGLLSIRREDGEAAGQSPAAAIARAEARLSKGDLAGAVAEIERLDGMPAEVAAPWLADARARLAADKALSSLTAHVVAAMGPRQ